MFFTFPLGVAGVYVRAYGDCRVRAAGCAAFEARKGDKRTIAVTLVPTTEVPCVGECIDGFCDSGCIGQSCVDASYTDASTDDCDSGCTAQPNALCVGAEPCTFVCKTTHRDCNGDLSSQVGDGCETLYETLLTDPDRCGDCTRSCPVGPQRACIQGECVKHVFVSSLTHDGDFGLGAPEAFSLCQMLATDAGLEGTYYPWLWTLSRSAFFPALSFTKSPVSYVRVDGVKIADDWADLTDGTLDQPLNVDEKGQPVIDATVFTNTGPDGKGVSANHCDLWRSNRMTRKAVLGLTSATDASWTQAASLGSCNELHRLYCFEQ